MRVEQPMTIYLIGFMGAGKTTLGKASAEILGWEFIDVDQVIEQEAGMSVREIFVKEGETHFRKLETEALISVATGQSGNRIVATGGGAPCHGENMTLLNQLGTTIYLNPTVETLTLRLRHQKAERPMIMKIPDDQLSDHISGLLQKREPYYRQAMITLHDDQLTVPDLIEAINHLPLC